MFRCLYTLSKGLDKCCLQSKGSQLKESSLFLDTAFKLKAVKRTYGSQGKIWKPMTTFKQNC